MSGATKALRLWLQRHPATAWVRRYQISITAIIALLVMMCLSWYTLFNLAIVSVEKARAIKKELGERDLRELIGHFEADEKFALEHNLSKLIPERRTLSPLLLPRQYYVGLPPGRAHISPRQPPRNCFVRLEAQGESTPWDAAPSDRVCLYFAENKSLGKFLFLDASYPDTSISVLKTGDLTLSADALKMTAKANSRSITWWLTQQTPPPGVAKGRYELTAVRENPDRVLERDKRVEGWAYTQKQLDGTQVVHIIARIDVKELLPDPKGDDEDAAWPPLGWKDMEFEFSRKDITDSGPKTKLIRYAGSGITEMSVSSLAESIYNTHGQLNITSDQIEGSGKNIPIPPPSTAKDSRHFQIGSFSEIDGDLLIATHKSAVTMNLPDTSLSFTVSHPGTVIEKGVWETLLALLILFPIGILATYFFARKVISPIVKLTKHSRQLLYSPEDYSGEFPYSGQIDEIGTLSKGLNELLKDTRERAKREQSEKEAQLKIREANLEIIGHEIRTPLQSLTNLQAQYPETRKYVEKIRKALDLLQGSMSPEDALSATRLVLDELDVVDFVRNLLNSPTWRNVSDIEYSGPESAAYCFVDDGAFEDVIGHILNNAIRFRTPGTSIVTLVECAPTEVRISISNMGPTIPDEIREKIFLLRYSTTPENTDSGTGIGLYVAKIYMSRMSGSIRVRNLESGVCFTIILPRVKADSAKSADTGETIDA